MGGVEMGMEDLTTFNSTVAYSRPTSVPARFLQPLGSKANEEVDPDIGKPMVWKRKRGQIKDNDFDISAINDKGVDKFRVGVKANVERKATTSFLKRLEEEFGPKAGNKVNSVNDMVRDYSSFTMELSEQI